MLCRGPLRKILPSVFLLRISVWILQGNFTCKEFPGGIAGIILAWSNGKINISVEAGFFPILCHLKLVFGFLQRASEPEELTEFIEENTKEFSSLTEDAYDMIASMSKTGELKELKKDVEQTEDYDMCKAIDMMVADGEKRGEARGEARGIKLGEERGEARGIRLGEARGIETDRNIFRLYKKGYKQNEIAEALKISLERVKEFLEE